MPAKTPLLLDLYCCQGGASAGYVYAGWTVVGLDKDPQPRYPFPFVQADALVALRRLLDGEPIWFHRGDRDVMVRLEDFDAIHASPPCQAKTKAQKIMRNEHPRLIGPTRELLIETGLPYVIENVVPEDPDSDPEPLIEPVMLCGAMFGIETYRHRLFETNFTLDVPDHPKHMFRNTKMGRRPVDGEFMHIVGNFTDPERARRIMSMPWASRDGLREAIPPVYAEHVGRQLHAHVEGVAA
ncbi:hypothetical protein NS183_07885 [Microbacterium testaceum]|uniref:DNA cytosine methyltransferase n=1 Tax=Microbacterium testaceum TaxID=2033 RepID=UPI0007349A45|nr:DNA cytosine methyltransferase [Microbacterium testaceum]KTS90691.1 hypothetical protein NS183_07885 [Microbacterium testaceum]